MKNLLVLGILLLFCIVQVSCGQSPDEKLAGMWWEEQSIDIVGNLSILTFKQDGTGSIGKRAFGWELIEEKPFKIGLHFGDKVQQVSILYVSDNEIELEGELKGNPFFGKALFSRINIETEDAPTDEIDLSSPDNVARSFWNALKNENIELAKRLFITKEEARQTGFGQELTRQLNRSIEKMEKRYIPNAKGNIWVRFKIEKEKSRGGIQFVGGYILFIKNNVVRRMLISMVKLKDGIWKIFDTIG